MTSTEIPERRGANMPSNRTHLIMDSAGRFEEGKAKTPAVWKPKNPKVNTHTSIARALVMIKMI